MRSFVAVLVLAVLASSLTLVYVRHQNRVKFVELRKLEAVRDELEIDWRELLIESRAVSKLHRVDVDARDRLGMVSPDPSNIIVVDMQAEIDRSDRQGLSQR